MKKNTFFILEFIAKKTFTLANLFARQFLLGKFSQKKETKTEAAGCMSFGFCKAEKNLHVSATFLVILGCLDFKR